MECEDEIKRWNEFIRASQKLRDCWMIAALDDTEVCKAMKRDIEYWVACLARYKADD